MKKFGIICIAIFLTACANIRTYEDYTDVYNPSVSISTVRVTWTDDAAALCSKPFPGAQNVIACAYKLVLCVTLLPESQKISMTILH